jgi:hypothetical protein
LIAGSCGRNFRISVKDGQMVGKTKERWRELCDLAAVVNDPKMFAKLARHIKRLLDAEQKRLNGENLPSGANS